MRLVAEGDEKQRGCGGKTKTGEGRVGKVPGRWKRWRRGAVDGGASGRCRNERPDPGAPCNWLLQAWFVPGAPGPYDYMTAAKLPGAVSPPGPLQTAPGKGGNYEIVCKSTPG